MKILAELSLIPIDVGLSLSPYIAACEKILQQKKLIIQLHALGTNIEGDINDVFPAIQTCIEKVHQLGAKRIITNIKISSRIDRESTMQAAVTSVEKKL